MPRVVVRTLSWVQMVRFHCPGCDRGHAVSVDCKNGSAPSWTFNGDAERPTFTPSILVNGHPDYINPGVPRCHSYVTDGRIQFLADSTHELAGQTIDLPEVD